jgi:hypothetical protein
MGISMRANRAFMHRVGRFLAAERGIRQYKPSSRSQRVHGADARVDEREQEGAHA